MGCDSGWSLPAEVKLNHGVGGPEAPQADSCKRPQARLYGRCKLRIKPSQHLRRHFSGLGVVAGSRAQARAVMLRRQNEYTPEVAPSVFARWVIVKHVRVAQLLVDRSQRQLKLGRIP